MILTLIVILLSVLLYKSRHVLDHYFWDSTEGFWIVGCVINIFCFLVLLACSMGLPNDIGRKERELQLALVDSDKSKEQKLLRVQFIQEDIDGLRNAIRWVTIQGAYEMIFVTCE